MYDLEKNCNCTVDWLRGTVPLTNVSDFIFALSSIDSRFDFSNFVLSDRGLLNYNIRFCHKDIRSLSFAFNCVCLDNFDPTDISTFIAAEKGPCFINPETGKLEYPIGCNRNPYILLDLSGDALRFIGADTLKNLCYYLYSVQFLATRFDLALDFFDKDNPYVPLLIDSFSRFLRPEVGSTFVSSQFSRVPKNYRSWINDYPLGYDYTSTTSFSLGNHGSSHAMFRCYDKFHEVLFSGRHKGHELDLIGDKKYWYRAELELHHSDKKEWAGIAFISWVTNDFNTWATFGSAISETFSIIDLVYSNLAHIAENSKSSIWLELLDLLQTINFVELVVDKFIYNRADNYFNSMSRYRYQIVQFFNLFRRDPEKGLLLFKHFSNNLPRGKLDPKEDLDLITDYEIERRVS